jgi:hypothetical protein
MDRDVGMIVTKNNSQIIFISISTYSVKPIHTGNDFVVGIKWSGDHFMQQ